MLRAVVGAVACLLCAAGCGGDSAGPQEGACTEIGCLPAAAQVQVSGLPEGPFQVRVCAEQNCNTARGQRRDVNRVLVELPDSVGETTRVRVEVHSRGRLLARDTAEIPVESHRPNGPDCPPVCLFARSRLDLETGQLEAA
jgi:hypothetical protein